MSNSLGPYSLQRSSVDVLFQALKMYLNCLMHPCTLLKHVQGVLAIRRIFSLVDMITKPKF